MFTVAVPSKKPSRYALLVLAGCAAGALGLAFAASYLSELPPYFVWAARATVWLRNFQSILEQGIFSATVFWAVSKFTETRTLLTVGFDQQDAGGVLVQGPDEANTVWIGRRYSYAWKRRLSQPRCRHASGLPPRPEQEGSPNVLSIAPRAARDLRRAVGVGGR